MASKRVNPEALPHFLSSSKSLEDHMANMFSAQEWEALEQGGFYKAPPQDPTSFELKRTLRIFFLSFQQGNRVHFLTGGPYSEQKDEPAITMFSHSLRTLPDGRPLLHVSYVDHELADRQLQDPIQRLMAFSRFQQLVNYVGQPGGAQVDCSAAELEAVKALLSQNAGKLKVPRWQRELLQLPSEMSASFLVPVAPLSEQGGHGQQSASGQAAPGAAGSSRSSRRPAASMLEPQPSQPGEEPPFGAMDFGRLASLLGLPPEGRAAEQPLISQARSCKEQGNGYFKEGRYREAEELYRLGAQVCSRVQQEQQQQRGRSSGASGDTGGGSAQQWTALAVDLNNNRAQALLNMAKANAGEARSLLEQVELACAAVLELDPGNAKAKHRQRQAAELLSLG